MTIGFNSTEKKEKTINYSSLLGEYVKISTHNGSYLGKLDHTNSDTTVTNPSLIDLGYFNVSKYEVQDKDIIISTESVISMVPVPKSLLENIVNEAKKETKKIEELEEE